MDILSALKSWGSQRSSSSSSKSERILSPRFTRTSLLSKSCRRRNRSQNLTICRENHVKSSIGTSNSLPTSRASSVFGDSCTDLPKMQNPFRQADYLDPFQGETFRFSIFLFYLPTYNNYLRNITIYINNFTSNHNREA